MKPEAIPFYGVALALLLGAVWLWQSYDLYKFEDAQQRQFCKPQVVEGLRRFGRRAGLLEAADYGVNDLVRFRTARSFGEHTARVVAVEGQRVRIEAGQLYVDGAAAEDAYGRFRAQTDHFPEIVVPAGALFVLQDERNRHGSERADSRSFGAIPARAVIYRFSPKDKVGS